MWTEGSKAHLFSISMASSHIITLLLLIILMSSHRILTLKLIKLHKKVVGGWYSRGKYDLVNERNVYFQKDDLRYLLEFGLAS